MNTARIDAGSFRDPSGRVYLLGDRVFRTVMPIVADDFEYVQSTGLIDELVADGLTIPDQFVDPAVLEDAGAGARYVIEHPRLPFISYPYEWSFPALRAAALLQLDIYLRALEHGVTLSDASAYNIQFQGSRPIFIDRLSFRRYRPGEFWTGHRQFCEQFVNPLLLRALVGVPHNIWYRGSLEGVSTEVLNRLLPLKSKLSWNVLTHVVMQASFQKSATRLSCAELSAKKMNFPPAAFERMLKGLREWISKLKPARTGKTTWQRYDQEHSYSANEARAKKDLISEFAAATKPQMLWDIGCNTGEFAKTALDAGAEFVVGFDFDHGALDRAYNFAREHSLNFLPLFLDAANPTPSQGWAESERAGLMSRASGDAVIALAVVHHLAISRNIPLEQVIDWLVDLAPQGIIEFVQKSDPMVQELLRLREDIFERYTEEAFIRRLESRAKIMKIATVSAADRRLFWFDRS